jgi:uncharacterized protein YebE (UPF0316 family)
MDITSLFTSGVLSEWVWLFPLIIFVLRTLDLALSTIRMLSVIQGRRLSAWVLGFIEALLFITMIAGLLANLENLWNIIAFAAGSATGSTLGVVIESRLAPGHSLLQVTSPGHGNAILEQLHSAGLGATEEVGSGIAGTVSVVLCFTSRKNIDLVSSLVMSIDPDAFITVHNVRELHGGWRA